MSQRVRRRSLAAPEAHLIKVCPGMAAHAPGQVAFPETFAGMKDPYRALIRAVVFQQLSGKAAQTIYQRVLKLFPGGHPRPATLLEASDETLRAAGLSRQKIAALRDIARKRLDRTIPQARTLAALSDEEIIQRLTAAHGVGRWTAEMYLIFSLGRPDVLPVDDLGVRKGAEKILRRTLTPKQLAEYGACWAPWRSAAAWHCWRAIDTVTMDAVK